MAALTVTSVSTCSLEPLVHSIEFKSGAVYTGKLVSGEKTGRGTFRWPSGLQYTGEYMENKRHGYGVQLWPDESRYEGQFFEDLRHGHGKHWWSNGEAYEGEYLADKKHGRGTYTWLSGARFTGQFEWDQKEGAGMYISPDGERFEGIYHGDSRDGEGVMTYPGGRQDVGVWRGTKLIQLKFAVSEASFDPSSSHPLPYHSLDSPDWRSRGRHGPKGPLEVASQELIQAAAQGEGTKVITILKAGAVHVDVVDRNGHNALFAAAIHVHLDIIDILLDSGADVNSLDSAGVSALTACHHLLYGPLPEVQKLLKSLPPNSQQHTSPSSPATEYTLHTSDFLSTPTNTPCGPESTTDVEVDAGASQLASFLGRTRNGNKTISQLTSFPGHSRNGKEAISELEDDVEGLCKTKSLELLTVKCGHSKSSSSNPRSPSGLTEVRSYPLLHVREKKVRFLSMERLDHSRDERLTNSDTNTVPFLSSKSCNPSGEKLGETRDTSDEENAPNKPLTEANLENMSLLPAIDFRSKLSPAILSAVPLEDQLLSGATNMPNGDTSSALPASLPPSLTPSLIPTLTPPSLPPSGSLGKHHTASATGEIPGANSGYSDLHPTSQVERYLGIVEKDYLSTSHESCSFPGEVESRSDSESCSSTEGDFLDSSYNRHSSNGFLPPLSEVPKHSSFPTVVTQSEYTSSLEFQTPLDEEELQDECTDSSPSLSPGNRAGNLKLLPPHVAATLSLKRSDLHASSVFSSTRYGPIMSAAQSTTLSCGNSGRLSNMSVSAGSSSPGMKLEESPPAPSLKDSIHLLLCRGADPNISPTPLPPLLYSIKAGDVAAVQSLVERGANTRQSLPKEFGGLLPLQAAVTLPDVCSAAIAEILLQYGADPNCEEGVGKVEELCSCENGSTCGGESLSSSVVSVRELTSGRDTAGSGSESGRGRERRGEVLVNGCRKEEGRGLEEEKWEMLEAEQEERYSDRVGDGGDVPVAGDNWGSSGFTPLHLVCAMSDEDTKLLAAVVPAVTEVLLTHGAEVNRVAKGQSPLSLSIMNGHDSSVAILLKHGADPNLPLGREVGSAVCALATHSAHRHRELGASLALLKDLLVHKADILLPVKVREEWEPGTVVDFAHETLKKGKCLACRRYLVMERAIHRAAKKFIRHLVCLLRCKALESIARERANSSDESLTEAHSPTKGRHRTMSAVDSKHFHFLQKRTAIRRREIHSAGAKLQRGKYGDGVLPLYLPEYTLRSALEEVSKIHCDDSGMEAEKSAAKLVKNGTQKSLSELFRKVFLLFPASRERDSDDASADNDTNTQLTRGADTRSEQKVEMTENRDKFQEDSCATDMPTKSEWTLLSFCYECGRSVGVHLAKCLGCRAVCYCSHSCKSENWKKGHGIECTGAQVKLLATNKQMLIQKQKARRTSFS